MVGDLKPAAATCILSLVDKMLQASYAAGCFPLVCSVIASTRFLEKILSSVLSGDELATVIVGYNNVLARIGLFNPDLLLAQMNQTLDDGSDKLLGAFIDQWCERVSSPTF